MRITLLTSLTKAPKRLSYLGAFLTLVGFASGFSLSAAIPYGSGAYNACTYDNCIISIATSGQVDLAASPTSSGVSSTAEDQVSVETGSSTGYTLTLTDSDTSTDLSSGSDSIAASAGTQAAPITLATNTWGYRVDSLSGFGAGPTGAQGSDPNSLYSFAGVPASDQTAHIIRETTGAAQPAEVTSVWFGVRVDSTKPSGTYTGQVIYTAVINE